MNPAPYNVSRPVCLECGGEGSVLTGQQLDLTPCTACGGSGQSLPLSPSGHADELRLTVEDRIGGY